MVASSTTDAELSPTVRVLDPEGRDIRFVSALDPAGVVAHGWLRASHRAPDAERTLPYRPWHPHGRLDPLTPGAAVPLDIEIWSTSVVVDPAGHRLAVTVQGRDFEFPGEDPWPRSYGVDTKGHAIFLHDDPDDRPTSVFGGVTT
ncbi:CocE/NonD family hydrolase C-terminal non-catalytic domain-containing protein [Streptomyces sp. NPDC087856]|uniref:CocE/NonD family hydrolase C-terminal non-catalytic domain-containing protein n=1 Tax=Streptomyces sp. NPDC087856 TaxID=3365811 RepID=UPI003812DBF9